MKIIEIMENCTSAGSIASVPSNLFSKKVIKRTNLIQKPKKKAKLDK